MSNMTDRIADACAVVGCPDSPGKVILIHRLGDQEMNLLVALCEYHHGWYEAYGGRLRAVLEVAA